jgi:RimJ/RimL family protein N-acetyltransferase
LIALSQMLADIPELAELDINPLLADADGVIALDARVRLAPEGGAGADAFAIRPYPAELTESLDWHGKTVVVRPIRPEDEAQHKAFVDRLQPEDLRLRFFSARRELPRSELARLTQIDYEREMAFIAVQMLPGGAEQTLGVVRAVADPDNDEAEFAIIVRSDLKGEGLGHRLLAKMIEYLRSRGTRRLSAYVLRENVSMRELAASHGFVVDARRSDSDALCYTLDLRAAEPAAEAPAGPSGHDRRLTRIKVRGASPFYSRSDGGADGAPPVAGRSLDGTRPLACGSCRYRCAGLRRRAVRCDGARGPGPGRAERIGSAACGIVAGDAIRHGPSAGGHGAAAGRPLNDGSSGRLGRRWKRCASRTPRAPRLPVAESCLVFQSRPEALVAKSGQAATRQRASIAAPSP